MAMTKLDIQPKSSSLLFYINVIFVICLVLASLVVVDVLVDGNMNWVGFGDGNLNLLLDLNGVRLLHIIRHRLLNGVRHWLLYNLRHDLLTKENMFIFSRI